MFPQHPWANPIRQRLDYTVVARRTFLVEDIPEDVLHRAGEIYAATQPEFVGRLPIRTDLEVIPPPTPQVDSFNGLHIDIPPPMAMPDWLVVGVWVEYNKSIAMVEKIQLREPVGRTLVYLKPWRSSAKPYHLRLSSFVKIWKPREKPEVPQPRHTRPWVI